MAYTIAAGDSLQVAFASRLGNQLGVNVRGFKVQAQIGTGLDSTGLLAALDALYKPLYLNILPQLAEYSYTSMKRLKPTASDLEVKTSAGAAGGIASDPCTSQSAVVVTLGTGFAGRANRGRMYIPFPPLSGLLNSTPPTPTLIYQALIAQLAAQYVSVNVVTTGGNGWTLLPVLLKPAPNPDVLITTYIVRGKFGTQRRRGSYGKTN